MEEKNLRPPTTVSAPCNCLVCDKDADAGVEGFSRRLITYQRGTCFGLYEDAHVAIQMMIRVIKVTIGKDVKGWKDGGSI